jgi:hypothetical protein
MIHQHDWRSLYTIPTDTQFLHTYNSTNLSQWFVCECGMIGRGIEEIKPVPIKQQSTRKTDAERWNRTLQVWQSNLAEAPK